MSKLDLVALENCIKCNICGSGLKEMIFGCGHSACSECLGKLDEDACPFCRAKILTKIKNFAVIEFADTLESVIHLSNEKFSETELFIYFDAGKLWFKSLGKNLFQTCFDYSFDTPVIFLISQGNKILCICENEVLLFEIIKFQLIKIGAISKNVKFGGFLSLDVFFLATKNFIFSYSWDNKIFKQVFHFKIEEILSAPVISDSWVFACSENKFYIFDVHSNLNIFSHNLGLTQVISGCVYGQDSVLVLLPGELVEFIFDVNTLNFSITKTHITDTEQFCPSKLLQINEKHFGMLSDKWFGQLFLFNKELTEQFSCLYFNDRIHFSSENILGRTEPLELAKVGYPICIEKRNIVVYTFVTVPYCNSLEDSIFIKLNSNLISYSLSTGASHLKVVTDAELFKRDPSTTVPNLFFMEDFCLKYWRLDSFHKTSVRLDIVSSSFSLILPIDSLLFLGVVGNTIYMIKEQGLEEAAKISTAWTKNSKIYFLKILQNYELVIGYKNKIEVTNDLVKLLFYQLNSFKTESLPYFNTAKKLYEESEIVEIATVENKIWVCRVDIVQKYTFKNDKLVECANVLGFQDCGNIKLFCKTKGIDDFAVVFQDNTLLWWKKMRKLRRRLPLPPHQLVFKQDKLIIAFQKSMLILNNNDHDDESLVNFEIFLHKDNKLEIF